MLDLDENPATPNVKQVKSDFVNPFGYQGMWRDEHTGLYHTHYRLYDPQHVRWLTPDPAGYQNGMNLYRFYGGPNGVDPLGDFAFLPFLAYTLALTAIDAIIGTSVDVYQGNEVTTGGQFKRVGKSFALNSLTGGFAAYGQTAKWGTKALLASSIALDTTVGTAYDTAIEGRDFKTSLGVNFAGSVLGNGLSLGLMRGFKGKHYEGNDDLVTVYRVQAKSDSKIVTGGAFARMREKGFSVLKANMKRKSLMSKVYSSNPDDAIRAMQHAQASGMSSPFISTTFSRSNALNQLSKLKNLGIDAELLSIRGPRSKGFDFENIFNLLGGRNKPNRFKDASMEEFGIPDLFIPKQGKSKSGFYLINRE